MRPSEFTGDQLDAWMKSHSQRPIQIFLDWYEEAKQNQDVCLDQICLSTATRLGVPTGRIVLFKGVSREGITFFTNYESQKGKDLEQNPKAAMVFYWPSIHRQVRMEGPVQKLTRQESEDYFKTRPRESQIGAWASQQSQKLESRTQLDQRVEEMERKFENRDVPCPPYWGGFRLIPERQEFWIGRDGRLHDRFEFVRNNTTTWKLSRICP